MKNQHQIEKSREDISKIDIQILEIVSRDASISSADLGKAVGLSSSSANERLRRLKSEGYIVATVAVIDPLKFSRDFLAFVRLKIGTTGKQDIVKQLEAIRSVEEIHSIAGEFSLLLKVRTVNADAMERVFEEIYQIPNIIGSETDIAFRTYTDRPPQLL